MQTIEYQFEIPRRDGWEEVLEPLVRRITGAQQANVYAGCKYENEVFKIKPHVLESCVCTYGKTFLEFKKNNQHSPQCFHTAWEEIDDAFKSHPKYHNSNILKTARVNMVCRLCRKNNIKYNPETVNTLCTCEFQREWEELNIKHDDNCYKVSANFWYKPSDLKIWWYKFFFRKAYSNQHINIDEFKEIVSECLNSLNL